MFQSCWIMNRCFDGAYLVIQIVSEATHVSLQMESMKLKRVEQAGKQRHSDIIPGESPEKFWPRFRFETFVRYNIAVAIVDAWSHKVFTTWSVEVTTKRYVDIGVTAQDFFQWVKWAWSKNCCRGFDHESRHALRFCLIMWCSLDCILLDFFILKFHKAFKSHLRALTMLSLIDGSSQSSHHQADESL